MPTSILQLEDLTIYYGKALAVDGVSMMVEDGETVAVIGPNGAGKTSLLRAVAGLTPSNGRILFKEKTISGLKAYEISRQGISLCPEGRRLFPELTVRQNMDLGAIMRKDHKKVKADLENALRLFPVLKSRAGQMARSLSGGEQQMLAIGRAMMSDPELLMLDEPSMGLALMVKESISTSIVEITKAGGTILLVEQDAGMAMDISKKIYLLENGRIRLEGTAEEMAGNPHVKEAYLGIA